jgi:hypothetical protein
MTCYPFRKIWVKEIIGETPDGRLVFAEPEPLRLVEDMGDRSKHAADTLTVPALVV